LVVPAIKPTKDPVSQSPADAQPPDADADPATGTTWTPEFMSSCTYWMEPQILNSQIRCPTGTIASPWTFTSRKTQAAVHDDRRREPSDRWCTPGGAETL